MGRDVRWSLRPICLAPPYSRMADEIGMPTPSTAFQVRTSSITLPSAAVAVSVATSYLMSFPPIGR
jgi:hypothetical protein